MQLSDMPDILLNNYYHNVRDALILYINTTPKEQWDVDEYTLLKDNFTNILQEINRRSEQMYNTG